MVKAPGPAREAVGWSKRRPRSCLLAVGGRAVIFDVGKEERGLNGASLFDIQAVTGIRTVFARPIPGKTGLMPRRSRRFLRATKRLMGLPLQHIALTMCQLRRVLRFIDNLHRFLLRNTKVADHLLKDTNSRRSQPAFLNKGPPRLLLRQVEIERKERYAFIIDFQYFIFLQKQLWRQVL